MHMMLPLSEKHCLLVLFKYISIDGFKYCCVPFTEIGSEFRSSLERADLNLRCMCIWVLLRRLCVLVLHAGPPQHQGQSQHA